MSGKISAPGRKTPCFQLFGLAPMLLRAAAMTRVWLLMGWLLAGCSESESAARDMAVVDGAGTDCGYAAVHNDPACPARHPDVCTPLPQACSTPGLSCAYPGA